MKKMEILKNHREGMDLLIERDNGNPAIITFSDKAESLEDWRNLQGLCNEAIIMLVGKKVWKK